MKCNFGGCLAAALCVVFCASGCQQNSENANAPKIVSTPVVSLAVVTLAPVQIQTLAPTPVPVQRKDVRIIGLMIGSGINARNEIAKPSSKYNAGDSIYALVRIDGSGPEATIKLRCKDDKENIVFEESKKITSKGSDSLLFNITAAKSLSTGGYHLTGLLDDYPEMAVSFEVSK